MGTYHHPLTTTHLPPPTTTTSTTTTTTSTTPNTTYTTPNTTYSTRTTVKITRTTTSIPTELHCPVPEKFYSFIGHPATNLADRAWDFLRSRCSPVTPSSCCQER